ncbi:MazG nucleotide pyrophosphohydrolase domain-containing protein [Streptococcus sp. sy018]|uniref:MazG nucleotide pyrophosphohydrolase domain-containing protein n=1 Tax=Streptococcus sp. sy018 TaxID=2600147 RepID=UPI0011B38DD4|nr:MazG nucleotide pyrophosphohydrolase domain-containing protein [Streptococcus sp. sy018]TWS94581.1 nucleotide pyrophosphohydrolase [Streptococcus sp. sy018]
MTQVTVAILEDYLRHRYGAGMPEQALFMKLVEEIGEVAELLNQRAGRKDIVAETDLSERLAEELADILHYTLALAAVNQLDMTKTILEKDRQASVKYGHQTNLETFMEQRR